VRVVDPKRVRHFAKAAGRLAKNDRIDARMIAEFGAVFAVVEQCEVPTDPAREHLASLVGARQALIEHEIGLRNQISAAPAGAARLSEREREVAELLVLGMPYRDIGSQLFISAKTVEHHVARIRRRLGAESRSEMLSMLRAMLPPHG